MDFTLYFDQGIPGPCSKQTSDKDYETLYNNYLAVEKSYSSSKATNNGFTWETKDVENFWNTQIKKSLDTVVVYIEKMATALQDGATITIDFEARTNAVGGCSQTADEYNKDLSYRRLDTIKNYLFKQVCGNGRTFKSYFDENKLKFNDQITSAFDSEITIDGKKILCVETTVNTRRS